MNKLAIALLSVVTAFSGVAPASAMPIVKIETGQVTNHVEQVRDRRILLRNRGFERERGGLRPGWQNRGGNRYGWRDDRRYGGWRNDGWRHDGWRYRRHYDRRDYGLGLPLGLATGAIIGGALAAPRAYRGNSHASWCYNRYRSYRAYDNTFQPYNGPRRACYSPYR